MARQSVVIRPRGSAGIDLLRPAAGFVAAPTMAQLITQGQNKQGDTQGLGTGGHGPGTVTQPNHQGVGFKSGSALDDSYDIWRSITTVAGTNGGYAYYDTISAATAASNYATYVTNSTNGNSGSPFDVAPGIDRVYLDTAATAVVEANDTPGPTAGGLYYNPTNGYTYKIVASIGGVKSDLSDDTIAIFMANGAWVFCGGIFNNPPTMTKSVTNPSGLLSPLGFSKSTYFQLGHFSAGTQGYVNPYSGGGCVQYNLNVKGFNYLNVNLLPTAFQSGKLQLSQEIDGDLFIYQPVDLPWAPVLNQWNSFRIPLSSLLNSSFGSGSSMVSAANGKRQDSFYKGSWNNNGSADMTMNFESFFSVN